MVDCTGSKKSVPYDVCPDFIFFWIVQFVAAAKVIEPLQQLRVVGLHAVVVLAVVCVV